MKKTDLAYMAGFYDGEGSISVKLQQGKWLRVEVSCSQNTADVLWMYVRAFRGNIYHGTRCLQWKTYGAEAIKFLHAVKPWLIVKRIDAEETIEMWNSKDDINHITELIQKKRMRHEQLKEHYDDRTARREAEDVR
jgi:hypothetical protein